MKNQLYVAKQKNLYNRNVYIIGLLAAILITTSNFFAVETQLIQGSMVYLIYCLSGLLATFTATMLILNLKPPYILLTQNLISYRSLENEQAIDVTLNNIDYFETRFNEIILYTKQGEPITLPLKMVKSKEKRWEIKEFLKTHIKQTRDLKSFVLATG